jgi:hypothetical protein
VFCLLQSGKHGNIQSVKDIQISTTVLSGDIPLKNISPPGCIYSVLENASTRNTAHWCPSEDEYTSLRSTLEVASYHENMWSGVAKSLG